MRLLSQTRASIHTTVYYLYLYPCMNVWMYAALCRVERDDGTGWLWYVNVNANVNKKQRRGREDNSGPKPKDQKKKGEGNDVGNYEIDGRRNDRAAW